jgi:hypothetical protein
MLAERSWQPLAPSGSMRMDDLNGSRRSILRNGSNLYAGTITTHLPTTVAIGFPSSLDNCFERGSHCSIATIHLLSRESISVTLEVGVDSSFCYLEPTHIRDSSNEAFPLHQWCSSKFIHLRRRGRNICCSSHPIGSALQKLLKIRPISPCFRQKPLRRKHINRACNRFDP